MTDSKTRGTPLIFVHGWGANSLAFKRQIEYFSSGFRVIAVDLPGHGPAPLSETPSVQSAAAGIAALVNETSAGGAHLVGWSLGAQVVCRAALIMTEKRGGERVKSLTLVSGTPCFVAPGDGDNWAVHPTKAKLFRRDMGKDFKKTLKEFILSFLDGEEGVTPEKIEEAKSIFFNELFPPDEKEALKLLDDFLATDMRGEAPNIKVPCLICHGDGDKIVPVESVDMWKKLLPSSETVIFENCGHVPFITETKRFNKILMEFLSRVNV